MVRVKKRASKRLGTKQREKVKKKVKEHHRKAKREAKKNPQWKSRVKKDPGIPNSFPYKEQLINEIETKRRKQEEEKEAAKEARRAEKLAAKQALNGDDDLASDDGDELDEEDVEDSEGLLGEVSFDAMPMTAPLFRGGLTELLASEDIKTVVLTLDARDPQSFRSPWLEKCVTSNKSKRLAVALSRADMVPLETLVSWIAHLSAACSAPVFPISSSPDRLEQVTGAEALVDALDLKGKKKGDVAVVGLSHSGRSTVADAILNAIGLPEDEDEDTEENSEWPAVLDTPALIPLRKTETAEQSDEEEDSEDEKDEQEAGKQPKDDDDTEAMAKQELKSMQTLMRNQGHVQRIKEPLPLTWALLSRVSHPEDLMLIYNVPAFGSFQVDKASLADEQLDEQEKETLAAIQRREKVHADTHEFLVALARATGRMKKRDLPDPIGASRILLRDWSHQMLGYYTQAPKLTEAAQKQLDAARTKASALSDTVLARKEWRKKFKARELRLKPISMVLGREALVLDQVEMMAPPPEVDSDDEDEVEGVLAEDDDEESWEDDEDEEDAETETAQAPAQLKSILKKIVSKRNAPADEDEEEEELEQAESDSEQEMQQLSRKERRVQKKAKMSAPAPTKSKNGSAKRLTPKTTSSGVAQAASAAVNGPAPGERYDFGAFF